jgi:hypothetical protein
MKLRITVSIAITWWFICVLGVPHTDKYIKSNGLKILKIKLKMHDQNTTGEKDDVKTPDVD